MTLEELRNLSRVSEAVAAAIRAGKIPPTADKLPYYGYLNVDMFDCPPFVLFTNNDTPVANYILNEGTYEQCSMAVWCILARSATGIVDIGANVGIYSLCAAKLRPDLAVHAFEPNPYAYARLRIHKHINELPNLIEHPVALGPTEGLHNFSWVVKPGGNIASGAGLGEHKGLNIEKCVVPLVTFDGAGITPTLGDRPLMKIDVEGAEAFVFKGLTAVLALRPDIILETFNQVACDEINALLLPLGYSVYGIREADRTLVARPCLEPSTINAEHNFNQLLTVRPSREIAEIAAAVAHASPGKTTGA